MEAIKPKVSIVCITYNHEIFIAKALNGFVTQKTNFPFEAIVADDCSTDNTRTIINDYASKFQTIIKPILRGKNIGSLPNLYDALSKVKGMYVAICDGDDYWTDEFKLQKQVDFLDNHPDYSICCHSFLQTYVDKSQPDKILSPWDFVSNLSLRDLFPVNPIGSLSVMYRWGLKNSLPIWMKEYQIGDLVLHLLHADKGKIGVLDEVMAVYQRHLGGVWYQNHTKENQLEFSANIANLLTDVDHELNLKYSDIITPNKGRPLKILFIAMENSPHSYRWIQTVLKEKHHIVQLYSSYRIPDLPDLFNSSDNIRIYSQSKGVERHYAIKAYFKSFLKVMFQPIQVLRMMENGTFGYGILIGTTKLNTAKFYIKTLLKMVLRPKRTLKMITCGTFALGGEVIGEKPIEAVINEFKPDIIHTLHTQTAGYQLMNKRKNWVGDFPIWVHSVWGSDLYYWERIPSQNKILRELLSYVDYFIGEGKRDQVLAKNLGYSGKFVEPLPASGGFDIELIKGKKLIKPSLRKEIAVKGYNISAGRFRNAIIGIIHAKDVLQDYTINIFSLDMSLDLLNAYATDSGLKFNIIPYTAHENILNMYSRSRIYIGCSYSDGLPASLLEAMAYGSFPIQTNTAITDEWVVDGITALLVPPDDTSAIERAIRRAIADDQLVDTAAITNFLTISIKANNKTWKKTIQKIYNSIGYQVRQLEECK
jgi:glycosyltransferase involved in cell wall biosynthesis